MTTFLELKTEVREALGGNTNATATDAIERGINAGLVAAAYLFEPPEVKASGSLSATAAAGSVSTSTLTRPMLIESVYSATNSVKVYRLGFEMIDMPWVPTTGIIQFYCLRGALLHYRPQADETLTVYYMTRPARLQNDSDNYPFATLEDFVVSFGAEYAWAFLEEGDSSALWSKVADRVSVPEAKLFKVREAAQGGIIQEVSSG